MRAAPMAALLHAAAKRGIAPTYVRALRAGLPTGRDAGDQSTRP